MRSFLEARPEIRRVLNMITLQLGNEAMVAVKAHMATNDSSGGLVSSINTVEAAFRQRYPQVRWSFFEPDEAD